MKILKKQAQRDKGNVQVLITGQKNFTLEKFQKLI